MNTNLLSSLTESNPGPFQWHNPSHYSCLPGGGIRITAPPRTDFFIDPAGTHVSDSASYLYTTITGDFVMQAHVTHPFRFTWDAAALMVRSSANQWCKLCFEATDFGTHAIVSVVTNRVSDDANGVNYTWPGVWLQIIRHGSVFAMHYAPDGQTWNMVRYCTFDASAEVKVGMVAQCPIGTGSEMDFLHFSLENRTIGDLRAGK